MNFECKFYTGDYSKLSIHEEENDGTERAATDTWLRTSLLYEE